MAKNKSGLNGLTMDSLMKHEINEMRKDGATNEELQYMNVEKIREKLSPNVDTSDINSNELTKTSFKSNNKIDIKSKVESNKSIDETSSTLDSVIKKSVKKELYFDLNIKIEIPSASFLVSLINNLNYTEKEIIDSLSKATSIDTDNMIEQIIKEHIKINGE